MTQEKVQITYVSSKIPDETLHSLCTKLAVELPVAFERVYSVREIFPLLSLCNQRIDFVVLDVDDIYEMGGVDMFDIVRTLHTLINCTVSRDQGDIKPHKRSTKIVALIGETTSPQLLKEVLSMPEIKFITARYGSKVNYELIKRAIENYINDGERAPKFVTDLVKAPRADKKKSDDIPLTARQRQVYDLIITRGSSNKHIAKTLSISESTVKLHIGAILKKYGLRNRTQLAVFAKKKSAPTEV